MLKWHKGTKHQTVEDLVALVLVLLLVVFGLSIGLAASVAAAVLAGAVLLTVQQLDQAWRHHQDRARSATPHRMQTPSIPTPRCSDGEPAPGRVPHASWSTGHGPDLIHQRQSDHSGDGNRAGDRDSDGLLRRQEPGLRG